MSSIIQGSSSTNSLPPLVFTNIPVFSGFCVEEFVSDEPENHFSSLAFDWEKRAKILEAEMSAESEPKSDILDRVVASVSVCGALRKFFQNPDKNSNVFLCCNKNKNTCEGIAIVKKEQDCFQVSLLATNPNNLRKTEENRSIQAGTRILYELFFRIYQDASKDRIEATTPLHSADGFFQKLGFNKIGDIRMIQKRSITSFLQSCTITPDHRNPRTILALRKTGHDWKRLADDKLLAFSQSPDKDEEIMERLFDARMICDRLGNLSNFPESEDPNYRLIVCSDASINTPVSIAVVEYTYGSMILQALVSDPGQIGRNPENNRVKGGSRLIEELFSLCIKKNIKEISLSPNKSAIGFYQKFGFQMTRGQETMFITREEIQCRIILQNPDIRKEAGLSNKATEETLCEDFDVGLVLEDN